MCKTQENFKGRNYWKIIQKRTEVKLDITEVCIGFTYAFNLAVRVTADGPIEKDQKYRIFT